MTLQIEVTPREEVWIAEQAVRRGVATQEVVRQLIDAQLSAEPSNASPTDEPYGFDATRRASAIAYLGEMIDEYDRASPEERRLAEDELAEFKRNMTANRAATGDEPLYP